MSVEAFLYILAPILALSVESGPLSVYRVGDGSNSGKLACGGTFKPGQRHIAHRRWRHLGCGRPVLVVSHHTGRYAVATVRDAGPFGVIEVLPKYVKRKPQWKIWTKSLKPPPGWRFRGAVDLSWDLWLDLGRPRFLTKVTMYFLPWNALDKCEDLLRVSTDIQAVLDSGRRFDQLAEALQNMQLRRGTAHLLDSTRRYPDFLGHGLVIETLQIDAAHEVPGNTGTVPGFYIPNRLRHSYLGNRNSSGNQVGV